MYVIIVKLEKILKSMISFENMIYNDKRINNRSKINMRTKEISVTNLTVGRENELMQTLGLTVCWIIITNCASIIEMI